MLLLCRHTKANSSAWSTAEDPAAKHPQPNPAARICSTSRSPAFLVSVALPSLRTYGCKPIKNVRIPDHTRSTAKHINHHLKPVLNTEVFAPISVKFVYLRAVSVNGEGQVRSSLVVGRTSFSILLWKWRLGLVLYSGKKKSKF